MKLAIADLRMALAWLAQRSNDVDVTVTQPETHETHITALDADNQLVTIRLFDSTYNVEAKIATTAYLKHTVKKP